MEVLGSDGGGRRGTELRLICTTAKSVRWKPTGEHCGEDPQITDDRSAIEVPVPAICANLHAYVIAYVMMTSFAARE